LLAAPFDRNELRAHFLSAKPFPFIKIDNFLDSGLAKEIGDAYPSFEDAQSVGRMFSAVNERKKIQISDARKFSGPVTKLNDFLASPLFLSDLSFITNIPGLLADAELVGGGIHMTGPGGHLDVHIDFNYIDTRRLHRRLNLLLYLNETWDDSWGGQLQLWDAQVKQCEAQFAPVFNRCVIFETNEISYHGVLPISPSVSVPRKSFATYYYTKEAPPYWSGNVHSTVFKARPDERFKGLVEMPVEAAKASAKKSAARIKQKIKSLVGRD
jgi:Rps23 Pro-64 3,4-dihydroxylase Tpa1-like proline 4-hydroxylase